MRTGIRACTAVSTVVILLLGPLGCGSLSKSSKSISKSISKSVSSPFASSSRSSSPEKAYREDVRDFTAAHVQSGGNAADLRREIATLAERHGITDWESNESTYRGIGAGLGKAGYRQVEVDAFKNNLTSNEEQAEWLQRGYKSYKE
jgi:hypothetical protein